MIKHGRIKLSKVIEDGTEIILDFRKVGDVLGEHIFSGEELYPVTACALEETRTCGFGLCGFRSTVFEHPQMGSNIIRSMSGKISLMSCRLESFAEPTFEDRIFSIVSNVAAKHGINISNGMQLPFRFTHEDLAFLVGAYQVSVTRTMQSLVKSGKMIKDKKKFILPC